MIAVSLTPQLAEQVGKALIAWGHHLTKHGQPIPAGYEQLTAMVRQTAGHSTVPELLTLDEAAHRARVSVSTLYRWRRNGLPTRGAGRSVRIARADLDAYLDRSSSCDLASMGGQPLAPVPVSGDSGEAHGAQAGGGRGRRDASPSAAGSSHRRDAA